MPTEEQMAYQKLVEIQAAVQNMELTISKFKEEIISLFTKELEKAGGQIQNGLEQSGEMQYWNLVSSITTNALALAGVTMLGYLTYKQCVKAQPSQSKTMIFTHPNKTEQINSGQRLSIHSP